MLSKAIQYHLPDLSSAWLGKKQIISRQPVTTRVNGTRLSNRFRLVNLPKQFLPSPKVLLDAKTSLPLELYLAPPARCI